MKHQIITMKLKLLCSVLFSLLVVAACSQQEAPAPQPEAGIPQQSDVPVQEVIALDPFPTGIFAENAVLYSGMTLIVGNGEAPMANAGMVVQAGRVQMAGALASMTLPAGITTVDLNGMTVMPMILDTHTHLSVERDALIEDLRQRVNYGVSAAMSLGMDFGEDPFAMRNARMAGVGLYRTAGRGITMPEPGRSEVPHWVNTVEEARAAVQEEAAQGVDIIKIWVDDRNGQYEKLTPELYGAIIDEAHLLDLRVTAHIFALEDAKGLLRAGIDAFAHGIRDTDVDAEVLGLFAQNPDVVVVPNMGARGVADDMSWLTGFMPADQVQQLQEQSTDNENQQAAYAIQARNLDRLNQAGVTIALGTDGNTPWAPHVEMEDMVIAGMSPMEVIVASTRNAAEFMGLEDMGTLEPGNSADFIVLEANPLDDIANTRSIIDVYLRGERMERPQ